MVRLCVVGMGHVGVVTASCFASLGYSVIGVDKDHDKLMLLSQGKSPFFEPGLSELLKGGIDKDLLFFTEDFDEAIKASEVIFICVGTPSREDGSVDLTQVEEVARGIAANLNDYKLIVGKSTVPVGTAKKIKQTIKLINGDNCPDFDVSSNPEFLKEGSAVNDFLFPDRVVLGVDSKRAEIILKDLYRDFDCPVLTTDIATSEIIKYASNAFLAMKISYINLVADMCDKVGANVHHVADGMGYDRRINREFLSAGAGYGGSCFPKDVKAFTYLAADLGINVSLLREVDRINEKRICLIVKRLEDTLWVCKDKKISVLGMAFKCNTDDVRESPALKLINKLADKGCQICCYDPKAMSNVRAQLNGLYELISFAESPYEAARGSDALVFMTDWPEFGKLDFVKIKELMRSPIIVDGRGMLHAHDLEETGFLYQGLGLGGRLSCQ